MLNKISKPRLAIWGIHCWLHYHMLSYSIIFISVTLTWYSCTLGSVWMIGKWRRGAEKKLPFSSFQFIRFMRKMSVEETLSYGSSLDITQKLSHMIPELFINYLWVWFLFLFKTWKRHYLFFIYLNFFSSPSFNFCYLLEDIRSESSFLAV